MGGGRKRGRTQRRHFKQGRENVWKHNTQRPTAAAGAERGEGNATWQPFATENPGFEEYYKVRLSVFFFLLYFARFELLIAPVNCI
jgi:multisite-specific tRNA:(cytosine-C5)-methyltransferase